MKKNTYFLEISIDNPCHESWAEMRPEKTGRHCFQCEKIVRDFSQATDAELADFFRSKPSNVCGRFRPEQLRRPLAFTPILAKVKPAPWRSAALIGGLMLGAGMAAGQGMVAPVPPLNAPNPPAAIAATDCFVKGEPAAKVERIIRGTITDEEGEVLIGTSILLVGTNIGTVSDLDGYFTLTIPEALEKFALDFSYVGYGRKTITIDSGKNNMEVPLQVQLAVNTEMLQGIIVVAGMVRVDSYDDEPTSTEFSDEHELPLPESTQEEIAQKNLFTYPNPFQESLNIQFQARKAGRYQVQLLDLSGRVQAQYVTKFTKGEQQLSTPFEVSALPAGEYFVRLIAPDGAVSIKRVIKAK